jgi:hypothetical protein
MPIPNKNEKTIPTGLLIGQRRAEGSPPPAVSMVHVLRDTPQLAAGQVISDGNSPCGTWISQAILVLKKVIHHVNPFISFKDRCGIGVTTSCFSLDPGSCSSRPWMVNLYVFRTIWTFDTRN